ncbi:MAG: 50S ribosomal protein L35 [Thermomicrobiaceae bacterium]|nr:50S ribosomal protein L35 [Thermomicrobiaceae bacterium]
MPKMKTHSGAKRRFKVTGSGKIMQMKGLRSHLRRKKAPRSKRAYDKMFEMDRANRKRIKRLLPYGA